MNSYSSIHLHTQSFFLFVKQKKMNKKSDNDNNRDNKKKENSLHISFDPTTSLAY